jgi:Predicted transcriptional regulators
MTDICSRFGSNVKKYRINKKLSQETLAEMTGLHRTYISDVERGKRSISLINIEKLSIALEIEVKQLFEFTRDMMEAE